MSSQTKPYLKEIEDLYAKIAGFESAVLLNRSYSPVESAHQYAQDDVPVVIAALSDHLEISPGDAADLEASMKAGDMDFMRLVKESNDIPVGEYQLLYIMSRPFFRSMKRSVDMDNMHWQDGRCPVCSATPSLSTLEKESQRKYFCSFCGTVGSFVRIGCPSCLTEDGRDITILSLEGEEGVRADTCEKCKSYVKTFEGSMTEDRSMDSLDIMSIPLDIIVQEKGFTRHAPNPVGMKQLA